MRDHVMVLATRNAGKVPEVQAIAAPHGVRIETLDALGLDEDAAEASLEDADTFEANALAKARWFFARCGGRPVLADDSGLAVDALGGRPGVHSKRWSGRPELQGAALTAANNATLAAALDGVTARGARFVCAAACVWAGGETVQRGETLGQILEAPRGTQGFGYDPWFWSSELSCSFGEADVLMKNRVSHRARAFMALFGALATHGVVDGEERLG